MVAAVRPSRHELIRRAVLEEIDARREELDGPVPINGLTIVVQLDWDGNVRRVTWRPESFREYGEGRRRQ